MSRILYVSYDGMTDPLGEAQVIPYLERLSEKGYRFHLVSFEKEKRFRENGEQVRERLRRSSIEWQPFAYTKKPPILSTLWDVSRAIRHCLREHRRDAFAMVHARSYVAALVATRLKKRQGVPFLFDMRGFWVDERVDGGIWNLDNPIYRVIHHYFKGREAEFLQIADAVVSLTEAGKVEIRRQGYDRSTPIAVIPCSVDFGEFQVPDRQSRKAAAARLGIPDGAPVAAYVGSLGTWYLLPEMVRAFAAFHRNNPESRFLVVTRDSTRELMEFASSLGIPTDQVIVRSALRSEVPELLAAADYGLFFIKPCYSKLASSPTKLGEYLAMGIPVVTNSGVGDVEATVKRLEAGIVLQSFADEELERAAERESELLQTDRPALRARARSVFEIEHAVKTYGEIYGRLAGS